MSVILSAAKDLAVVVQGIGVAGSAIDRCHDRKILRFAQDDGMPP
jgi:hypothetical protein